MLRGINVSGHKKIKMLDLRRLYESLGFQNVITYIQSGNVIFDSDDENHSAIVSNIENAIRSHYQFEVPVQIYSQDDFHNIVANMPFESVDLVEEGSKVFITFLSVIPHQEPIAALQKFVISPELLVVKGRQVYLYCPNSYGISKLSNTFLEKKLGLVATTRNWKSVNKLLELATQGSE